MRTLKLIAAGIMLFAASTTQAQVSVNLNIGTAPSWGPVGHIETEYYYLPDVEAYYDIRATQFIYFGGGRWVRSRHLPYRYRDYDLNRGYKVVLNDYHGARPYNHFKSHKVKYYKGYNGRDHRNMGYNNNRRVYVDQRGNDNHRRYDKHREYNKHDNRNKGHNKGHGNRNDHGNDRDRD